MFIIRRRSLLQNSLSIAKLCYSVQARYAQGSVPERIPNFLLYTSRFLDKESHIPEFTG
jgi:hypothetical protein